MGSSGGHLVQLLATKPLWDDNERAWVCFKKPDAIGSLAGERCYWGAYPTNRNLRNLLRNTALAVRVLRTERPNIIMSTGAGLAIPYFVLGRLFGATLVYIEVYDRFDSATVTGRICERLAHIFALQWPEQQLHYKRGKYIGPLL